MEAKYIDVKDIVKGTNIRTEQDESLMELAKSIEEEGLINPITVRKQGKKYCIVAGHRRFSACRLAGLDRIKCCVMSEYDDPLAVQIAENLQRKDMSAYEWVGVFDYLKKAHHFNDSQIAKYLHKTPTWVCQTRKASNYAILQAGGIVTDEVKKITVAQYHKATKQSIYKDMTLVDGVMEVRRYGKKWSITIDDPKLEKELEAFIAELEKKAERRKKK